MLKGLKANLKQVGLLSKIGMVAAGVFGLSWNLWALDPSKTLLQYECQTWRMQNGLPARGITAITQTRDGFLWIGTQRGLARYDGVEFKTLALPKKAGFGVQAISALSASSNGGLWFGVTEGPLGFYSLESGFSAIAPGSWDAAKLNTMTLAKAWDGAVWMGSDNGVACLDSDNPERIEVFTNLARATVIYADSANRVWIGTADQGLFCRDKGELKPFHNPSLGHETIFALAEDRLGQIWVGTPFGLFCYDAAGNARPIPRLKVQVKALALDSHGSLWIGTSGEGLLRWEGTRYTSLRKVDGLAADFVTALFEDREGSLWVGTQNGISQLVDVKFPLFSTSEGLPDRACHGVTPSRHGGLWAATGRGLCYLGDQGLTNYAFEAGLTNLYVKRVFEASNGDVYFLDGDRNVSVLSQGQVVARFNKGDWPIALEQDELGVVVGIAGKLFRVNRTQMTPYAFKADNSPTLAWVRNLSRTADGALLVSTVNGLFRVKDGQFVHWGVEEGLPSYDVLWACEDQQGTVWVGTSLGIAFVRGNFVKSFNEDSGLFDNYVSVILPDDHGWLWMQSSRGIFRVNQQNLEDVARHLTRRVVCVPYDGPESVKTSDTTEVESTACRTADGRLWFPSPLGIVMINPAAISTNRVAPVARITRAVANGFSEFDLPRQTIKAGKGDLEFQYTAASFIAPQKVRFRYRLEGYDPQWVEAGSRRSAFYTNLKPGTYRFEVIACNADGYWSSSGDSHEVTLPPHYYQTAWFEAGWMSAAAVLLGVVGWGVARHLRRRQHRLQEANELLEQRVRERTDQLAEQHKELVKASRQAGMAEVASSVLHNVGNVLNSINVSATLVDERVRKSKAGDLKRLATLLEQHATDLGSFFAQDPRGAKVPQFLAQVSERLAWEQALVLTELASLRKNVEHVKDIVSMQQSYARLAGVIETVELAELVEDSLRMNAGALARHEVQVVRDLAPVSPISTDKHKVLQILVNLIRNAKYACDEAGVSPKRLIIRLVQADEHISLSVIDNGVGIPSENLTRIFNHGFTTRKNGHGFGLHSGALAAKELGGALTAFSEGRGKGATFTLTLPRTQP